MVNRITPDNIAELRPNQIFVFGSNEEGFHRRGAARFALDHCGANIGQGRGLQGQSYAIVTKKDFRKVKSSTLQEIEIEVLEFIKFAIEHPEYQFLVTKIATDLAGYSIEEIAPLFDEAVAVRNISLPVEFWDILNKELDRECKEIMGTDVGAWEEEKEDIIRKTKIKFDILK